LSVTPGETATRQIARMEWQLIGTARYYSLTHSVHEFYPGPALSGQSEQGWSAYRRQKPDDVLLGKFETMEEAMNACERDLLGLSQSD
jgi:hypothetical protein